MIVSENGKLTNSLTSRMNSTKKQSQFAVAQAQQTRIKPGKCECKENEMLKDTMQYTSKYHLIIGTS